MRGWISIKDITEFIRGVKDFPKAGILFRDITPLLQNAGAFDAAVGQMADMIRGQAIDCFVGIEARGFIFAAALAARLSAGLALVRKPGKLPRATLNASYDLEYGRDTLEIHKDALPAGKKAVVVDDLLATGGTAAAAGELATRLNADLAGYLFLIELTALGGAARLRPANVWSVIKYDD